MAFPKSDIFPQFENEVGMLSRALAYPARILILRILHDEGPMQFTRLVNRIPLHEGTVTSHLKKLRSEGLISVEVCGLVNIYHINTEGIERMFALQKELYVLLGGKMVEDGVVVTETRA